MIAVAVKRVITLSEITGVAFYVTIFISVAAMGVYILLIQTVSSHT